MHECTYMIGLKKWHQRLRDVTSPDDMQKDVAVWTVSIWLEGKRKYAERRGEERKGEERKGTR